MTKIDLHIHTSFSDDGEFSPREIVEKCRAQNLTLIAVTDHNSVRGIPEALAAAEVPISAGAPETPLAPGTLRVLSGVELDCTCCGQNFHLLGYGFDYTRPEFAALEQDILQQEKKNAEEKIRLITRATGIPADRTALLAASKNGVVTGEMIAESLLAREDAPQYEVLRPYLPGGEKSDMPNVRFYWDFFSENKPAYVPIRYLSLPDAAALIHSAGGSTVLAHPGQNLNGDDRLLPRILSGGVDGIEAFSSYHSAATAAHYLAAARQNRLLVTCGSDFHGKQKPSIRLGGHGATLSDDDLLDGIEAWLA